MTKEEYIKAVEQTGVYASYEELKDMSLEEGIKYLETCPKWITM